MADREFRAGDRVRPTRSGSDNALEWTVVGPDPTDPDRTVVIIRGAVHGAYGVHTRIPLTTELTLIPDTVTVTVTLPREEADEIAAFGPLADAVGGPIGDGCDRFRNAIVEALQ